MNDEQTEQRLNMAQDLVSDAYEAGITLMLVDAINILDSVEWDYEAALEKTL